MKTAVRVLVFAFLLFIPNVYATGSTLSGADIVFQTSDDKVWSTEVLVSFTINTIVAGFVDCCDHNHTADHFARDTTITRALILTTDPPSRIDSSHGTLIIYVNPAGEPPSWVFVPTLILQFNDGTRFQKTFGPATLGDRPGIPCEASWDW
jgi:hypothetical protein